MTAQNRTEPGELLLEPAMPRAGPSGARSGALLAAASGAGIVANYVFLLGAGRILGSRATRNELAVVLREPDGNSTG